MTIPNNSKVAALFGNGFVKMKLYASKCLSYGFDSGGDQGACGRRSGRLHRPPCDLGGEGYCTSAGTGYPWHAVKRFVRENQGLMRRMYGDQRHGQVLRAELEEEAAYESNKAETFSNPSYDDRKVYAKQELDLNMDNELFPRRDENEPRFLRDEDISNDDVLNTKFVYSEEPSISFKFAGLKSPHFRPTTHRTSTTTASTTLESTRTSSTTKTTTTANGDDILETTTENSNSDATTAELTTDTTTNQSGKGASFTSSTTEDIDALRENEESKPGTILFQDMDAQNKNKVHVNYQMKGVNACPVKEEVVAPFWANNTRGEVLALLNMYPYEQYVHWEKCTHEHRQMYCRDGCRCEQQYRLHRLLAYDPHNECRGVFSDWFRFPSCCVCKCYTIPPAEFRVTSRSPRTANSEQVPDQGSDQGSDHGLPDWYRRKNMAILSLGDHG